MLKKVKIFGEEFSVKARVEYIEGYSGHADPTMASKFCIFIYKKTKTHILSTWTIQIFKTRSNG